MGFAIIAQQGREVVYFTELHALHGVKTLGFAFPPRAFNLSATDRSMAV